MGSEVSWGQRVWRRMRPMGSWGADEEGVKAEVMAVGEDR